MDKLFSKSDTTFFKGIAILLIVSHNYFHTRTGFGLENEESFNSENIQLFLDYFKNFNISNWIAALFGFLGHYGVQIFIFFSAYGLTIQYGKKNSTTFQFIFYRLKKIYFLLFFGIIFCIILYWLQGKPMTFYDIAKKSFLLGTTASSFTSWYLTSMFAGPFWFFALIIQLYLLFPVFYKWITSFRLKKLWIPFLLSYLLIYPLHYLTTNNHLSLFGNIFGHLPEVFLGISMAYFKIRNINKSLLLIAFPVFILSQYFEFLFPLSFLSMTIILIYFISFLENITSRNIKNIILFSGEISMILFIVNGRFRFIIPNENFSLRHFIIYLPILFILSYLLFLLYNFLQKKLKI